MNGRVKDDPLSVDQHQLSCLGASLEACRIDDRVISVIVVSLDGLYGFVAIGMSKKITLAPTRVWRTCVNVQMELTGKKS